MKTNNQSKVVDIDFDFDFNNKLESKCRKLILEEVHYKNDGTK